MKEKETMRTVVYSAIDHGFTSVYLPKEWFPGGRYPQQTVMVLEEDE